jgi:hypothetical protein
MLVKIFLCCALVVAFIFSAAPVLLGDPAPIVITQQGYRITINDPQWQIDNAPARTLAFTFDVSRADGSPAMFHRLRYLDQT